MLVRFAELEPLTHTQHNRCDPLFVSIVYMTNLYLLQGELEHRRVKRFYARTNKNNAHHQITKLERREVFMEKCLHRRVRDIPNRIKPALRRRTQLGFLESESLPYTSPDIHHHISKSQLTYVNAGKWSEAHGSDPAVLVCHPLCCPPCEATNLITLSFRTLSLGFEITSLPGYWGANTMVTS